MGKKDISSVAKVAASTCALVLTLYYTLSSGYAGTDKKIEAPNNHLTEAKLDDLTVKMRFSNNDVKPGESPEVIMDIVNTSGKKIEQPVQVQVASIADVRTMSRMAPLPQTMWSTPINITLDPNQQKTVKFKPDYTKKNGESLSLSLLADGKTLRPDLAVASSQTGQNKMPKNETTTK